jgi:hypothetical protein
MDCASYLSCVAVGRVSDSATAYFAMATSDGGVHWRSERLPNGVKFTPFGLVSCVNSLDCMAIATQSVPNPDRCGGTPPHVTYPPGFNGCDFGATTIVSTVVITTDGGATWQLRPLPTNIPLPQLGSLACATATVCWLGGSEAVPVTIGNVQNGGSPVLLGTTDGGSTWTKVTFIVPPGTPNYDSQSFLSMGPISCPSPDACVALGSVAQGSPSTPVYSFVADSGS